MNAPYRILPILLASLVFTACVPAQAAPDSAFVVADLFATPGKSLATIEATRAAPPNPTVINVGPPTLAPTLPLPTAVVLQPPAPPPGGLLLTPPASPIPTLSACAAEPPLPFDPVWQNAPQAKLLLRCPVSGPQAVGGVWQVFERGVMFRRDSDQSIFVISDDAIRQGKPTDSWWRVADTWHDGDPDSDQALQPPASLKQPLRGFGKLWRANGFIRAAVGWAVSDEARIDSQWMTFEGGWMMTGPGGLPIYTMIPLDAAQTSGTHLVPAR